MIIALKSIVNFIVSCDVLGLTKSFQGSYFDHAFSKVCQYAYVDENNCEGLKYLFIEIAQSNLQKCITWLKKSMKSKKKWNMVVHI